VLNPEGSANPYAPKFNPEDLTGKTLILSVSFLYPEHATSGVVPEFVEDTTFGAHLAVMFPRDGPELSRQRTQKGNTWTTDPSSCMQ
jgi:hypothetical protein